MALPAFLIPTLKYGAVPMASFLLYSLLSEGMDSEEKVKERKKAKAQHSAGRAMAMLAEEEGIRTGVEELGRSAEVSPEQVDLLMSLLSYQSTKEGGGDILNALAGDPSLAARVRSGSRHPLEQAYGIGMQ